MQSLHGRCHGKTDAGITARRFDDDRILIDLPGLYPGVDHGHGHSILDAAQGIEVFKLGQDPAFDAVHRLPASQLQERRMADEVGHVFCDMLHKIPPC